MDLVDLIELGHPIQLLQRRSFHVGGQDAKVAVGGRSCCGCSSVVVVVVVVIIISPLNRQHNTLRRRFVLHQSRIPLNSRLVRGVPQMISQRLSSNVHILPFGWLLVLGGGAFPFSQSPFAHNSSVRRVHHVPRAGNAVLMEEEARICIFTIIVDMSQQLERLGRLLQGQTVSLSALRKMSVPFQYGMWNASMLAGNGQGHSRNPPTHNGNVRQIVVILLRLLLRLFNEARGIAGRAGLKSRGWLLLLLMVVG
mmetsp:Transcript_19820/g.54628  ORF Transcript_19820/g.54628 Transcript_19820/m.54628 type:complete len:253 (-) Transcript_19820:568-1326(-)